MPVQPRGYVWRKPPPPCVIANRAADCAAYAAIDEQHDIMSDSTFWIPFAASIAGGIIGGVIGSGLIGTWRQHKLTERREKAVAIEERKRKFSAFMAQFRSEVTNQPRLQWEFGKYYLSKIPDLEREASMIRADFSESHRGKFNELIAKAKLTGAEADKGDKPDGRQEIAAILDAIAKFSENQ